jgi:cell division protein FtsZ
VHFTTHEDYPLVDIDEAMSSILGDLIESEEVDLIEGQTTDNSFEKDEIKVTIIATGFDDEKINLLIQLSNLQLSIHQQF